MGGASSKNSLQRRNSVIRRSQRKSIHSLKSRAEKIVKDIKSLKSTEEDTKYNEIQSRIDNIRIELKRKIKDLQPELNHVFNGVCIKCDEAQEALKKKLQENQEVATQREQARKKKEEEKEMSRKQDEEEVKSEIDEDTVNKEETQSSLEAVSPNSYRKSVELKFVKFAGTDEENTTHADVHEQTIPNGPKSPEQKRASVLKYGVQVLPGVSFAEITSQSKRLSKQYDENYYAKTDKDSLNARLKQISHEIEELEYRINDFIGKKYSTQYNSLRDDLNKYLIELNAMESTDEEILENIKLCKNYVGSSLSFLDEKVTESALFTDEDDDVFTNNNNNNVPYEDPSIRLQKLSKTTAI